MQLAGKEFFLGEISNATPVATVLQELTRLGITPHGIDVPSTINIPYEQQESGVYKKRNDPFVLVRKDEDKLRSFIEKLVS